MNRSMYAIEILVTLLSRRDMMEYRNSGRCYILSPETEKAVDIKKKYVSGRISGDECVAWCQKWVDDHDITDAEWKYLNNNGYLGWIRETCTTGAK